MGRLYECFYVCGKYVNKKYFKKYDYILFTKKTGHPTDAAKEFYLKSATGASGRNGGNFKEHIAEYIL